MQCRSGRLCRWDGASLEGCLGVLESIQEMLCRSGFSIVSMGMHNRCSSGHGSHIGPALVKKDAWGCVRGAVKVVCVQYMGVAWSERCVMVHRSFIYF